MRLSRSVYGQQGQLLLKSGVKLTSSYIASLKRHNILAVIVDTMSGYDGQDAEFYMRESTRIHAMASMQRWMQANKRQHEFSGVIDSVKTIVEEILAGRIPSVGLAEISASDLYTFAHSIDVCAFSVYMGIRYGLKKDRLLKLGIGSILHDLGKVRVPPETLNKPGKLTEAEFQVIKNHPVWGYNMLLEYLSNQLSDTALEIVLNHHERFDGNGYPNGLKGDDISDMTVICALADVYSALTADRVYRRAFPLNEAYEIILASGNTAFKLDIVRLFAASVHPFPVDTLVLLSTGQIGCVLSLNSNLPFRPVIMIAETREIIDLAQSLSVVISRSLTDDEAQAAMIGFQNEHVTKMFIIHGEGKVAVSV
jgi:HD-GYP domain-containing protein (c-di-GMP phosphodiesterase class II)